MTEYSTSIEQKPPPESSSSSLSVCLPQKRYYRQRAHSNPIADHFFDDYPITPDDVDWSSFYPLYMNNENGSKVEFLDIGCGYGGLLIELSSLYPESLMLGIEIRQKVSDYVVERIRALRVQNPGKYNNINCIRSNAMKYMPNFFNKSQLSKIFFLFPDPHFKKQKHKWRIISPQLLTEYAYFLRIDGRAYFASDVKELFDWMYKHFDDHPLFIQVQDSDNDDDPVVKKFTLTEEGKKVTRNGGQIWHAVFRRIDDPKDQHNKD
ncbi:tRNA (guanine-N(7)-)-methyltransferase, variant 2 [Dermatophagoides farinae]|uniref:tRNA (guanine-N(7)-)-methyltransferase n=1 Tax=Dermatophagoides farinae TaxID=6954 RepID=A0A922HGJ6_DERFA|nr:tRNA (guanine-N(7)-)-methyltransferase [Dermatophagoides farinae]KAH9493327.1 tRNA (guanine-N(7)-)-methyltransferase, variant 2 [Dermatophagoides farinae]